MALSYDFDIHWIIPQDVVADPAIAKMMGEIGFETDARANYVALFRDPKVVDVLRGADERVRSWFEKSGFGFNVFDSGAGPGRYPPKDEAARIDDINRLSDNMKTAGLKGANLNGFDFGDFLKAVVEAKPAGRMEQPGRGETPSGAKTEPAPMTAAPQPAARRRRPEEVGMGATVAAAPNIDAAFANPKAGAPVASTGDLAPTLDDLIAGTVHNPALDAPMAGPDGTIYDDLKFRPTVASGAKAGSGVPVMPMIMIGAVMFFFLLFMVVSGTGGGELVAR